MMGKSLIVLITLGLLLQGVVPKGVSSPFIEWNRRAEKTGLACESHKLFLKCPNRSEKLVIYNTFYGRQTEGICQHQILSYKGQCTEDEELINKKIMQLCANENKCSISASRDFLLHDGNEKCPHLYKYLTVKYKCVQTPHIYKKCYHKKCVTPAKCWPQCSKACCEPPPPPKWTAEELALLRDQWSGPGYKEEFPGQYQTYDSKRYNIPGTYLYGMRNSAQSPGYARSRLNYPQVQRNYGYYSAYTRSQVPSHTQQTQQAAPSKKSSLQMPTNQNPSYQQQYYNNYAARSKVQYPDRYQKYANWLMSLRRSNTQQ